MTLPEWNWEQHVSGAENSERLGHLSVLKVGGRRRRVEMSTRDNHGTHK